jgi:acetyltransferase-like isoleucine patch superfamily enzyme
VRILSPVKVQSQVSLTAHSMVEDDVFLGPAASTTRDNTIGRHGPDYALRGRRSVAPRGSAAAQCLVPGVEVGDEAFAAAGAVVTKDVPVRAFMVAVPALQVRDVGDDELVEL